MVNNVGTIDKVVRVVIGIILLSLLFFLNGNIRFIGLIGIIPIAVAIFGYCPLYTLLGINTCPMKK